MTTKLKIPKIRFKEFSGEWEEKKLGEVSENIKSGKSQNNDFGNYDLYGSTGIIGKCESYSNNGNYILVARVGANAGSLNLVNGKFGVTDNTLIIDLDNKTNIGFIYNFLYNFNLNKLVFGSGQPLVTGTQLKNIKINLPSSLEQQKIASFISSVDEKIEKIKEKKKNLEEYKKGIMQKIFSQELRFKDENGEEFGEWEEKKLGENCKLQGGFAFKSEEFKKSGIPIIRISNISNNNNYIDLSNIIYYDEITNDENYIIKNGDLIIAMSGATTGKSSIYNLKEKAYLNQRVGLFKANLNKLNYGFLIQFVFSDLFYKQLDGVLVAGAQPNISGKDIENFIINLPTLKEQEKIADFLSGIDEKIEKVIDELRNYEEFKKGLLQGMFV